MDQKYYITVIVSTLNRWYMHRCTGDVRNSYPWSPFSAKTNQPSGSDDWNIIGEDCGRIEQEDQGFLP